MPIIITTDRCGRMRDDGEVAADFALSLYFDLIDSGGSMQAVRSSQVRVVSPGNDYTREITYFQGTTVEMEMFITTAIIHLYILGRLDYNFEGGLGILQRSPVGRRALRRLSEEHSKISAWDPAKAAILLVGGVRLHEHWRQVPLAELAAAVVLVHEEDDARPPLDEYLEAVI